MTEIELVIKLDEEVYRYAKRYYNVSSTLALRDMDMCMNAIINGTPLPKGHGKIVDIDKLIDSKCNECGHIRGVSCDIPCYAVRRMLAADTIIEADKE